MRPALYNQSVISRGQTYAPLGVPGLAEAVKTRRQENRQGIKTFDRCNSRDGSKARNILPRSTPIL